MVCPFCESADTNVINSRNKAKLSRVWRRRKCNGCLKVFTTNETPNYDQLVVTKRNGHTERFSYSKLFISVWRACEALPKTTEVASALTETILTKTIKESQGGAIATEQIGTLASQVLQRYNASAFVRYASYQANLSTSRELKRAMKYFS